MCVLRPLRSGAAFGGGWGDGGGELVAVVERSEALLQVLCVVRAFWLRVAFVRTGAGRRADGRRVGRVGERGRW
eukprot:4386898-Lingulodinium_polyedra.AAC.1